MSQDSNTLNTTTLSHMESTTYLTPSSDQPASQIKLVESVSDIISEDTALLMQTILVGIISGVIGFFGTVVNIIDICVFLRQGVNDSVTISLMGLAVAELGSDIAMVWLSICFNPLLRFSTTISFDSVDIQYTTACWPHICLARVTSWITAYITFERCLCVVLPLKVKQIITPGRTFGVILTIYISMFLSVSPVYYATSFGPTFKPKINKTVVGLVYAPGGPNLIKISNTVALFTQVSAFIIVIVCTSTLTRTLVSKARWRLEATAGQANSAAAGKSVSTDRDQRVVKMVTLISIIFLMCFTPCVFHLLAELLYPPYSVAGPLRNSYIICWSFMKTFEALNSCLNIFVYYSMSSKFRLVFVELFCLKDPEDVKKLKL